MRFGWKSRKKIGTAHRLALLPKATAAGLSGEPVGPEKPARFVKNADKLHESTDEVSALAAFVELVP
jgi:hypothetical protein